MSNSHPLHPFFTSFEPVAHPGRCCCNGTVVLPNGFGSSTFRLECSLIARPRTPAHHLENLQQPVAAGCKRSDRRPATQYGRERRSPGGGGPIWTGRIGGGGSSDAGKDTAAKRSRKRRREPTVKIEEKKKTGPKGKGGEGPPGWVRPLFVHDENDRLVRCSPPSSAGATGKKGEYVTCLICHQKVSFNKYSWTTPRQHMRKHNINSPSDLETVLQLAKQCWKEGRDFPEERLPRAGDSKG